MYFKKIRKFSKRLFSGASIRESFLIVLIKKNRLSHSFERSQRIHQRRRKQYSKNLRHQGA